MQPVRRTRDSVRRDANDESVVEWERRHRTKCGVWNAVESGERHKVVSARRIRGDCSSACIDETRGRRSARAVVRRNPSTSRRRYSSRYAVGETPASRSTTCGERSGLTRQPPRLRRDVVSRRARLRPCGGGGGSRRTNRKLAAHHRRRQRAHGNPVVAHRCSPDGSPSR